MYHNIKKALKSVREYPTILRGKRDFQKVAAHPSDRWALLHLSRKVHDRRR